MTLQAETKINKLLQSWPNGTVALNEWLEANGVSRGVRQDYERTKWIESIDRGAFKRGGDDIDWYGGLYALQQQAGSKIHVGARTALGLLGRAHYLELNQQVAHLFAPNKTTLPAWFKNYNWSVTPELHNTDFLPPDIGLTTVNHKLFEVKISGQARAIMECLYLAPKHLELVEAYQLMEGLDSLRPVTAQALLSACRSIKVTRLFLYMAEKAGNVWFKHLDIKNIDQGSGARAIVKDGVYIDKYKITVPRELAEI